MELVIFNPPPWWTQLLFRLFTMAEVATCKNLSKFHVISYWSEWRFMEIVRELLSLERCPESMRENLLKGQEQVTRGPNIVADGWAGASNPHPYPNLLPTLKHTQKVSKTLVFPRFNSMTLDGPTDQRTNGLTDGQSLL